MMAVWFAASWMSAAAISDGTVVAAYVLPSVLPVVIAAVCLMVVTCVATVIVLLLLS